MTGECRVLGIVASELSEGETSTGEVGVNTGELGERGAGTSQGSRAVS